MGDDAPLVMRTPAVDLIAQINRFMRAGEFGGKILPLASGNIDASVAYPAILIHQARLLVAQAAITDAGTGQLIADAAKGLSTPVAFVMANLPMLTASISGYADLKGMPAADYHADGGGPASGLSTFTMVALGVGALGLVWFFSGRKRR